MPEGAIACTHNVTIGLSGKTYIFETGAATTSDSPWVEFQGWCVLLAQEHPQEAVNVFRKLLDVLPADSTTFSWALNFIHSLSRSKRGPPFILAKIGAINAWMSFPRRHRLRTITVSDGNSDNASLDARDAAIEEQETLVDSEYRGVVHAEEAVMKEEEVVMSEGPVMNEEEVVMKDGEVMNTETGFRLLRELYTAGYDERSQQFIELRVNEIATSPWEYRQELPAMANIAREEANYRLESYCFQLIVEMDGYKSMFLALSPLLEYSEALYTHIAQDVVELVNFLDRNSHNSLHGAVSIGSLAAVRLLIERGDKFRTMDDQGLTCIHRAASKGYRAIAQLFLEHDRSLFSCVDENGYLPVHVAAENGHDDILLLLLDADQKHVNAQVQRKPRGNERQHADKFRMLGNLRKSSDEAWKKNGTALHLAAANGHEETVTILLHRGAMVDEKDCNGWTALHKASARWQYGVANILLRHGAKVNLKTEKRLTALDLATKCGHTALVELLLQHHAEVSGSDGSFEALRFSAEVGDFETATLLLDHKADIQAKDASGNTPLHLAAKNGHLNVAKLLLEHGAEVEAEDVGGNTALHFATDGGNLELAKILLDEGATEIPTRTSRIPEASMEVVKFPVKNESLMDNDGFGIRPMAHDVGLNDESILGSLSTTGQWVFYQSWQHAKDMDRAKVDRAYEQALILGDIDRLEVLCSQGCPINVELPHQKGRSALLLAIQNCRRELIKWLLAHGAKATEQRFMKAWISPHGAKATKQRFMKGWISPLQAMIMQPRLNSLLPILLQNYQSEGGLVITEVPSLICVAIESNNNRGLKLLLDHIGLHENMNS